MDETSLIRFEDGPALLCLLFCVRDNRVLDELRRLLLVVSNHLRVEVVNEAYSAALLVDRSFY